MNAILNQKPIGRSGLITSSIALGCATFGREIDESTCCDILDYAFKNGITLLDTAEAYGGGNSQRHRRQKYGCNDIREATTEFHSSEIILGRWLRNRGCRSRLLICTKVSSGAAPENIRKQLEASCSRLGVDYVDIYLLHKPSPEIPIAESLDALTQLVQAGKIRCIGVSNFTAQQLTEALAVSAARGYERIEVVQPSYNLVQREIEFELLGLCRREHIAVLSYSPLAAGFLSGKYTPDTLKLPEGSRFHIVPDHADIYFKPENFRIVEHLRKKSAELKLPMVRLALWWAITNPDITACLVGARSIDHINNALYVGQMSLNLDLREEMSVWK